ncbi:bifunctional N(6)-L-threonylcarbamoyladenine synthase/serine/threonine protein kinase [Haloplanus aerogenes]|uniref:Probable bifunctional tRNA threonylcarbamoyladenosine biosynthesis protein n=1 Tax=Haloplanus aerogenes TaxID=660522 RepID=A0A3M0DRW9_9EURY|nr:bifunctional N(6)-L-threonylcarbamoyladenine synthase/serine/threonine protein kinase [Haloplanus aerogenes]AZH24195.1 bifunctional N(6)-L-threonylcarbamoyladenine synthase/serine/threonine protein kinase [Haloplanus aerogenes]RMB24184.1 N6-L-threonylcarbamoyladenine synthase/protein kinase Bud32 [Haloplanus aerogenes]
MRILGIEGTAWAASAAVFEYDPDDPAPLDADQPFIETDAYQPESGGIHPREAAEHMGEAIPAVVESALDAADGPIDAVAFSRGPGLGPCLRIVGTAARALAGTLDVPLVGVNHMVAHLEIGRYGSGFDSPVCLNASGANAHLLGYHDGRYRVLGETMDTGVGNAIDKFTRHVGWSHPGGPKVEEAAKDGEYVDLPYVVKGMDFSFSGLMSAAKAEYDEGTPVEDVCFSLQETIFAMLTEVAERALSLTGSDELVLGGGVGQNERLREMLSTMCADRGAEFYAPDPRYLRDNAGMIAVLGAKMLAAGDSLTIEESAVDPNFRPDEVDVTWRADEASVAFEPMETAERQGAEAIVTVESVEPRSTEARTQSGARVIKRRLPKAYRHPALDERLRRERTVAEARLTSDARRQGVPTPVVRDVDVAEATITFDRVGDRDLGAALTPDRARMVGAHLARLHRAGIVHGDPTVRNVRVDDRCYLIDFGLGYHSGHVEDHAMDCHVFGGSVRGTAGDTDAVLSAFEAGYAEAGDEAVLDRLREVEGRGRYT